MGIIETKGLTKIYVRDFLGSEHGRVKVRFKNRKVAAIKDLNLEINSGEVFGLIGPNGAGKTTVIKIMLGLIFPTSGTATIMGRPLGDKSVKARIGFLPENPYFYDYLKGWEFLDYYGRLYGMRKSGLKQRIPRLLELVGLQDAAGLPLKGYSKGMLQRIGLAQALLNDPEIIFLDEPQSGLDPFGRKEVRDIILKIKEEGKTVFFSSHILSDAELICDRVGILSRGKLIDVGFLSNLLSAKTKSYEVVAANISTEAEKACEAVAQKVIREEGKVMFQVEREEKAKEVVQKILSADASLVSYTPVRETLEEYFIRQIEGGSR